jgi:hypothetical protein
MSVADWLIAVLGILVGLCVSSIPALGLMLICRPIDHQFEWEKRMQGLNSKNREIEAAKRQEGE